MPVPCRACGYVGTGQFCAQCGARFGAGGPASRERRAWRAAGIVALLAIGLVTAMLVRDRGASATPPAAAAGEGALPDLSTLTPRERFDRLYSRVMEAAQSGDTATLARFAPMAIQAYSQLETPDADASYHAAVLELHIRSDAAAALRLADAILTENPRHLFGFLIRGTAARLSGDSALLTRARAGFLAAWQRETGALRPEYREHEAMLKQFKAEAAGER